ncbi:uncharacterized protein PAC_10037 [Phialocephala subalpina]|uniref:Glycosyl hydrolase family 43 protein n=1 Tax=Phialocephala subalpina TaxID=576137 RepID=A0A1L7X540_9HELO|nr:uncharacterized protein PAC_10037 [Phialocephala subalpina]
MLFPRLTLVSSAVSGALAASWIVPGAVWTDTSGNKIDAHGGGIVQRGDTFYWIGQSTSDSISPYLYSSTDLLNWTNLGKQASIQQLWRPKIAKPNGSFWIYGQVDRNIQALVSTQMVGGYVTHGAAVTIPPNSYTYSDTGMFKDTDGSWYILTSADHNISTNSILVLSIRHLTHLIVQYKSTKSTRTDPSEPEPLNSIRPAAGAYEAPGILKVDGVYFLIVSAKTGWRSNPNKMFYSTSITGSWTGPFDIAPQAENTYNSQNTFELTISGSKQTTYMYMGDSWDSKGGTSSNYIWLPIAVSSSAKTFSLQYHAMWKIDVGTGVVSYPTTKKRYEAEDAVITGRAAVTSCNDCISKRAVHRIGSDSQVTFQNVIGTGHPQWFSIHYSVNSPEIGEAHIFVNDEPRPTNISLFNSRAGYHKVVPMELTLKPGNVNTITFGAMGSEDFEVHIDGIELFEDEL